MVQALVKVPSVDAYRSTEDESQTRAWLQLDVVVVVRRGEGSNDRTNDTTDGGASNRPRMERTEDEACARADGRVSSNIVFDILIVVCDKTSISASANV